MSQEQRWILRRSANPLFYREAGNRFRDLDPIVLKVLWARKIDSPGVIAEMLSRRPVPTEPLLMPDMAKAVSRVQEAMGKRQAIVVYGDYDVDGICASALLVSGLRALGANVSHYIPDRFSEAYGLNDPALDKIQEQGADLVITVDCGIRSVGEVARAMARGLDIIVTDHHSVPDELPPAVAVVDAKRPDSRYPFPELSGTGVAYRLVQALCQTEAWRMTGADAFNAETLLDLVALATVCDVVPLRGENRKLVQQGLDVMRTSPRLGIRALAEVAETPAAKLDSQAIGFRLGPRLNAAGRLQHADLGWRLMMAETDEEARVLATQLDQINQARQALLGEQVEAAEGMVDLADLPPLLLVHSPEFHEGIVGLIASRLVDRHYRPALAMRVENGAVRGSARSVEGFHVTRALESCADLLTRFGGHAMAAGFSLPEANLPAFKERMLTHARESISAEMLQPRFDVDAIVALHEVTGDTPTSLARLEPFGEGNPEAALATLGLRVTELRPVGRDAKHLKLAVSDGQRVVSGIAFRQAYWADSVGVGDAVDIIYTPQLNHWNGNTSLQMLVHALRPTKQSSR